MRIIDATRAAVPIKNSTHRVPYVTKWVVMRNYQCSICHFARSPIQENRPPKLSIAFWLSHPVHDRALEGQEKRMTEVPAA